MKNHSEEHLDSIFAALSDKSRRHMLLELTKGERSVKQLGEPLGLSKQLVSKHLKVLERAGLINKEKEGRMQKCQFNPETFEKVQSLMNQYKTFWNNRFDALENYIDSLKENDNE